MPPQINSFIPKILSKPVVVKKAYQVFSCEMADLERELNDRSTDIKEIIEIHHRGSAVDVVVKLCS